MKRQTIALICAALALCLAGCGKSKNAQAAEEKIAAIGSVTLQSRAAVEDAEAAYQALTEKERQDVENYDLLQEARSALDSAERVHAVEEQIAALGDITADSGDVIAAAEQALNALSSEERSRVSNASLLPEARQELEKAVHEAELAAKREMLLGVWDFTVDITELLLDAMEQELEDMDVNVRDYVDECLLGGVLEFRDDGTYVLRLDKENMKAAVDSIKPAMIQMVEDMVAKQLGQELANAGLQGDFSSLKGIDAYLRGLGLSLDSLFKQKTGYTLREFVTQLMDTELDSLLDEGVETVGHYLADFDAGKLFLSDSPSVDMEEENCELFRFNGDRLEIQGYMGQGSFTGMYPLILTKKP